MHSGASGVASPQNVRKCVFTFYGRAAPVARERNPTTPNAKRKRKGPAFAGPFYCITLLLALCVCRFAVLRLTHLEFEAFAGGVYV
jgi:hypothetical protein